MSGTKRLTIRTYLLRGGRFAGLRLTCESHNRPSTLVLFATPVDEPGTQDVGDLYELTDDEEYLCDAESE